MPWIPAEGQQVLWHSVPPLAAIAALLHDALVEECTDLCDPLITVVVGQAREAWRERLPIALSPGAGPLRHVLPRARVTCDRDHDRRSASPRPRRRHLRRLVLQVGLLHAQPRSARVSRVNCLGGWLGNCSNLVGCCVEGRPGKCPLLVRRCGVGRLGRRPGKCPLLVGRCGVGRPPWQVPSSCRVMRRRPPWTPPWQVPFSCRAMRRRPQLPALQLSASEHQNATALVRRSPQPLLLATLPEGSPCSQREAGSPV